MVTAETRLVAITIDRMTVGDIRRVARMSKLGARLATVDSSETGDVLDAWYELAMAHVARYTNCTPELAESLSMVEFGNLLQAISREIEAARARWESGDYTPTIALCTITLGGEEALR